MNNTIDLSPEHKSRLLNAIGKYMPNVEILAYGSRINGRSHDGSDLDIALRTHDLKPIEFGLFALLRQAIDDANLPFIVDIRDWASLPSNFKEEILKQPVVLNETIKDVCDDVCKRTY